jgi:hypothetical protein
MEEIKQTKKSIWARYRWPILIFILLLISAAIVTTVFVIRAKQNSQTLTIPTSNTSIINGKYNVSNEEYVLTKILINIFI